MKTFNLCFTKKLWKKNEKEIEKIENNFPCFVTVNFSNVWVHYMLTCRQEDAKAIEDRLASLV